MNPNKITKWFFNSKKIYCPQCADKSPLHKSIHIYGSVSFDNEYVGACYWDYDAEIKTFTLGDWGNKSPEDHNIFFSHHTITTIVELKAACILLNIQGYKIDEVRLITNGCDNDCNFTHKYELQWFEDSKSLLLEEEWIKFYKYKMHNHYAKDESCIIVTNAGVPQVYEFKYILNINFKKYKSLKTKIQQILLIG